MAENDDESVLKVLVELVDQVTEPLNKIHEQFEEFESSIWDLTYAFSSLYLGYELLEHLIEPASEFQDAQLGLALASNMSAEALKGFKEQAEELSQAYPKNLEDITKAQTHLYQVFRDQNLTKEGTEWAAKLATVMGIDTLTAARTLASGVQVLGVEGKTTEENMALLSNKLTILQTQVPQSQGGAARMARDLARVGAEAKAAGIPLNATLALMGTLSRLGTTGARGPGAFASQLINELSKVNDKGVSQLAKIGAPLVYAPDKVHINLIKTIEAWAELGKRAPESLARIESHLPGQSAAIAELVAHVDELKDSYYLLEKGTDDSNQTQDVAAQRAATLSARLERLHNAVNNLLDALGTKMIPALTKFIEELTKLVIWVNKFTDEHPTLTNMIVTFLGLGAAVLTIVAGLGFAGKLLSFFTSGVGDLLETVGGVEFLEGLFEGIAVGLEEAGVGAGALAIAFIPLLVTLGLVALAIYEIIEHIDTLRNGLAGIHEGLRGAFGSEKGGTFDKLWDLGLPTGSLERSAALEGRLQAQGSGAALHYSPVINMGSGTTAQALHDVLKEHSEDMLGKLAEQQRAQQRLTFRDTTLAGAH